MSKAQAKKLASFFRLIYNIYIYIYIYNIYIYNIYIYIQTYLSIYLPMYLSIYLSNVSGLKDARF